MMFALFHVPSMNKRHTRTQAGIMNVCMYACACECCIPSSSLTFHVLTVDTGRVCATTDNRDLYKCAGSRSPDADLWTSGKDQIMIPLCCRGFWLTIRVSLLISNVSFSLLPIVEQKNEHAFNSRDLHPVIHDNLRYINSTFIYNASYMRSISLFHVCLHACLAYPLQRKSREADWNDSQANRADDKTELTKNVE